MIFVTLIIDICLNARYNEFGSNSLKEQAWIW